MEKKVVSIIGESDIKLLNDLGLMPLFGNIKTKSVVNAVVNYISNNPDTEVSSILSKYFKSAIDEKEVDTDIEYVSAIEKLTSLSLFSISSLSKDELKEYERLFDMIMNNSSISPYRNYSNESYKELIETLKSIYKNTKRIDVKKLMLTLKCIEGLCTKAKHSVSTPYKNMVNYDMYSVKQHAVRFNLDVIDVDKERWRCF